MKIAIDVSPLQTGHKVRGVGFYLERLKNSLLENFTENEYIFFSDLKEIPSDTQVVHFPYFDPFQITLPRNLKQKVVVTVHDLTPLIFPKHFPAGLKGTIRWQIQRYNLRHADAVITDSHAAKEDIQRLTGIAEEKINVVYLASGDEFQVLKNHQSIAKKIYDKYNIPEKFLLYVGDVTWNKNLPRLVRAAIEQDLPLVMAGKALVQQNFDKKNPWNNDLLSVQELAKKAKNIYLLGFVPTEDLVVLYNLAQSFVWPSLYEGFGLPLLEAMQCGCPVISTKQGCMPEVAGDAAYYFDGYDSESLKHALEKVWNSDDIRHDLSSKGLRQAKKFSWTKTAEQTITVYKRVMVQ